MFSDRLKKLRNEANMTQTDLGKRINVTKSAISGYEKGIRTPDSETLKKIASVFDVTTDYLLGISDNRNINTKGFTLKEEKDMKKRIEDLRKDVKSQEGLLFDGEPMSDDAVDQLLDIIEFAEKQATKLNRRFTTKDNRKKYDE